MEKATESGFVKGCQLGRKNVLVSHLQFAEHSFLSGTGKFLLQELINSGWIVLLSVRIED